MGYILNKGYSGVNFGHLKSEVFHLGGGGGFLVWNSRKGLSGGFGQKFTVWGMRTETCLCITDSLSHTTYVETKKLQKFRGRGRGSGRARARARAKGIPKWASLNMGWGMGDPMLSVTDQWHNRQWSHVDFIYGQTEWQIDTTENITFPQLREKTI